jgi:hypothetical protein
MGLGSSDVTEKFAITQPLCLNNWKMATTALNPQPSPRSLGDHPEKEMAAKSHLTVLWTTDNPVTAEKMVLMYTVNALAHGWWEKVILIVWGAAVTLVRDNLSIRRQILPDDCIGPAVMVISRDFLLFWENRWRQGTIVLSPRKRPLSEVARPTMGAPLKSQLLGGTRARTVRG